MNGSHVMVDESARVPHEAKGRLRLLVYPSVFPELYARIIQEMQRRIGPIEVLLVAFHPEVQRVFERHRVSFKRSETIRLDRLGKASRHADTVWNGRDKTLRIAWSPRAPILADRRHIGRWPAKRKIALQNQIGKALDDAIEHFRPEVFLIDDVSCLAGYLCHLIATRESIPSIQPAGTRLPGRIQFSDSPFHYDSRLADWRSLNIDDLPPAGVKLVSEVVEIVQAGGSIYSSGHAQRISQPVGASWFFKRVGLFRRYLGMYMQAPHAYMIHSDPLNLIATPALLALRRAWQKGREGTLTRVVDRIESGRSVFYPMHYQPEASSDVLGPQWSDQVATIEQIAFNLPVGYQLVVKDHPIMFGRRPASYYRRIEAIENVIVVPSHESTHRLVCETAYTITISGTVALEAMILGKPAILLGRSMMNHAPNAYPVRSLDDLGEVLKAAANITVNASESFRFLSALYMLSYPGFLGNSMTDRSLVENSNIRNLCQAIQTHFSLG